MTTRTTAVPTASVKSAQTAPVTPKPSHSTKTASRDSATTFIPTSTALRSTMRFMPRRIADQ